jgi:hypothetical protein
MRVALCTFFGAQRHSHDIPVGRLGATWQTIASALTRLSDSYLLRVGLRRWHQSA